MRPVLISQNVGVAPHVTGVDLTRGVTVRAGSAGEVFTAFLKLGLTSFGGPTAHLGYFRTEFVERRGWLDDRDYADLVTLCQFLPGPASSQVGFGLGLRRAGGLGALAAFTGFTLPSAVLLVAFAYGASLFTGSAGAGLVAGLTIVAVAIVAQAVWGMARTLAPDRQRAGIAVVAAVLAIAVPGAIGQLAGIVVGAMAGWLLCRSTAEDVAAFAPSAVTKRTGAVCLVLFGLLLLGAPLVATGSGVPGLLLFATFFTAGALVFGGGHVVLPLLQSGVVAPGWVSAEQFLAGYGAAQAVPGPLFTFAAYLGTLAEVGPGGAVGAGPAGLAGAGIALVAIFLPGFLLLVGVLPFWDAFRRRVWAQAVMRGANAAVVGILGAALYDPVFTTAVTGPVPFCLALACFVLLVVGKVPPWVVVVVGGAAGAVLSLLGLLG